MVRAIHGEPKKPALGAAPSYAEMEAIAIDGLDKVDSLILQLAGIEAVRDGGARFATEDFLASVAD